MITTIALSTVLAAQAGSLLSASPERAAAPLRPHTWQRWEHALTSARSYDNPYADVAIKVTYTGPGDRTLHACGFWDGGNTFRIRCAFPTPGVWQ